MQIEDAWTGVVLWVEAELSVVHAMAQAVPAAHRGFLTRARGVPIESLYEQACRQKRRLVLSGACSWSSCCPGEEGPWL